MTASSPLPQPICPGPHPPATFAAPMPVTRIPYADTRRFSALVTDYLAGHEGLRELHAEPPTREGLHRTAQARPFSAEDRLVLSTALAAQYAGLALPDAVSDNLAALRRPDALTVTTGHQLCLFGGPLYVPFKILNVVRLARQLTTELGRPVLPVFWMATEDHDRAEIDHTWLNGSRVHWPGHAAGAVGRMPLHDIDAVLAQAAALLGDGDHAPAIRDLLYAAYRPDRTLAQATRHFVNALFGRFGVLCVDGDDPALKQRFVPHMREEVLNQVALRTVSHANARLAERYAVQAHAREINLFHLCPGHRRRIVQEGEGYHVLDGGPSWSPDQLLRELEARPEDFSPNVLLRPVYQETILPNIAYVGGGGELAYWLQLKPLFHALQVPMPAVLLRTSAGFLPAKHMRQWADLGLTATDLFASFDALRARVAAERVPFSTDMAAERERLQAFYHDLAARAAAADPSLKASAEAHATRALHGLERFGKALLRSAKRREADALARMDRVHAALFPGGGLQERRDNILPMLAAQGEGLLDRLLAELDPLDPRFTLFVD
jgi:bacillithiol biosynthesis cysteine-adding enzyme BshC